MFDFGDIAKLFDGSGQSTVALSDVGVGMGGIIKGFGDYQNNNTKANVDELNATMARANATRVAQESATNENQLRFKQARQEGEMRAAIGQSGTGAGTGSNLLALQQDEMNNELSALNLRYQGTVKRYSLLDQAALDDYSANIDKHNATTSLVNTGLSTVSTMLKGYKTYVNNKGS